MVSGRYREEVFNVLLALLLQERGVVSAPEKSLKEAVASRRRIPDVLVDFQGLRTVIEGKIEDQANARERVLEQARERVTQGIAHIALAVIYPARLREQPFSDLSNALAGSVFRVAASSEAGEVEWAEGGVDYVADLLKRTFQQLVLEDVVTRAVAVLNEGLSAFARSAFTTPEQVQKAVEILGIGQPPKRARHAQEEDED